MRKVAGTALAGLVLALAGPAQAAPGDLDTAFGTGGFQLDSYGTYPSSVSFQVNDLASANGQPLSAGGSGGDFAVARTSIDGNLDNSFGTLGTVFTDFGGTEAAAAVWRINGGADAGKFVVAGTTDAGGNAAAVARFNANGSLDGTFSGDGKATVALPAGEVVTDVAVGPTGRVAVSVETPPSDGNFKVLMLDSAGAPDTTFAGGVATASTGPAVDDSARTLAFQSTGKLIVAGRQDQAPANADNFLVVRFGLDGTLDNAADADPPIDFEFDGIGAYDFNGAGKDDDALSLAIDPTNDRIVIGGATDASGLTSGGTLRLHEDDGALDTGFGGGAVFFPVGGFSSQVTDVAVSSSGKTAVWGIQQEAASIGGLQRLNASGGIEFQDTDTGDNTDLPGGTFAYDLPQSAGVAFDPGGAIMLAGNANEQPSNQPGAFVQLWSSGTTPAPQASYGGDGTAFVRPTKLLGSFGSTVTAAPAGAGAPAGSYYVGGTVQTGDSTFGLYVARHLANGPLDTSFGSGGMAIAPVGTSGQSVFPGGLAVQPDGRIVIVGGSLESGDYDALAARFTTSGGLDATFDGPGPPGNGFFRLTFGAPDSGLRTAAVDPAGRILLSGYSGNGVATPPLVARLTSVGALDATFGTGGVFAPLGGDPGVGFDVALQTNGAIVTLAGSPSAPTLVRIVDGAGTGDTAFDPAFGGGDGLVAVAGVSMLNDGYDPLSLDPASRPLVAGGSSGDMAVARFTGSGEPDPAFSADGLQVIDFGGSSDSARSALGLPGGGSVLAGNEDGGAYANFALAQLTPGGELEPGFGGDGRVSTDFGAASAAYGFGALSASSATAAGIAGSQRAAARYQLFVPATGGSGGGETSTTPQTGPGQPAPPPAAPTKCKKKKKKGKKSASAAAKCKKKKKKK